MVEKERRIRVIAQAFLETEECTYLLFRQIKSPASAFVSLSTMADQLQQIPAGCFTMSLPAVIEACATILQMYLVVCEKLSATLGVSWSSCPKN